MPLMLKNGWTLMLKKITHDLATDESYKVRFETPQAERKSFVRFQLLDYIIQIQYYNALSRDFELYSMRHKCRKILSKGLRYGHPVRLKLHSDGMFSEVRNSYFLETHLISK